MLGSERRRIILQHAAKDQSIETQALADKLGVSLMTIRRDIRQLEREGFIRQTYGGATVQITKNIELGFNSRSLQYMSQKRLIGARAAQVITPGRLYFLGAGTTTAQLAQFLPLHADLLIVTSSLSHASLLSSRKFKVVVIGGAVDPNDLAMTGPIAEAGANRFYADLCIVGAAGLDAEIGVTELDCEFAAINRLMIERSRHVMVLADHSKLGRRESAVVAPAARIHTLITDGGAPESAFEPLRAGGMTVIVADAPI